jgi:alanine dehydrogenase
MQGGFRMPKLLILSRRELESLLDLKNVIEAVEQGFVSLARGDTFAYPVIREFLGKYEGIFGIKSGFVKNKDYLGFKAGGYWKDNPLLGIPAHQSLVILYDPKTGIPKAVMDGNFITVLRTGAVGAIAAMIGCGVQGRIQLIALRSIFNLTEIRCYDLVSKNAQKFIEEMSISKSSVRLVSHPQDALKGADILVTTTPSTKPIVSEDWVSKGTHINAMGADTKGKQEIDPRLYQKSKVVVDDLKQCSELGETQHNLDFLRTHGIHAQLGEIISGQKPGREDNNEITLFDATGIAFQDLVTAGLAVSLAEERKVGTWVDL